MSDQHKTTGRTVVLDYISRGRVSLVNVASHFGLTKGAALILLRMLEGEGAVRRAPGRIRRWEIAA